jgi:hypothetical protein
MPKYFILFSIYLLKFNKESVVAHNVEHCRQFGYLLLCPPGDATNKETKFLCYYQSSQRHCERSKMAQADWYSVNP